MKIKVTQETSILIDGELKNLTVGDCDLKESAAKVLIDKGRAELVEEKKPETKKQTKK
tara:strand:- start:4409 stop:4582 length:174 start_codon:yes stop_codon:yes gene_type:complete